MPIGTGGLKPSNDFILVEASKAVYGVKINKRNEKEDYLKKRKKYLVKAGSADKEMHNSRSIDIKC